ncbi:MAG: class I SAM-dependent methyltransferase [Ignavibacteriae bacterium]|nr:class I SAM-dependent methyltransferase [Ignavibacteriota bacterium]
MKNPWLEIDLYDYENHMSLSDIAQAQYLSTVFENALKKFQPNSVAIVGCSGGNGLEKIDTKKIERIVCVDINFNYLKIAKERFENSFKSSEFICADICSAECKFESVDLVFAGLIFEYLDFQNAISNLKKLINPNGYLAIVLQLLSDSIPEVTPSKFKSLEKLQDIFAFIPIQKFKEFILENNFHLCAENITKLKSGKSFHELVFQYLTK